MKLRNVLLTTIILGSIAAVLFFSLFYYRFSFNYEVDINDQYILVFSLPLLPLLLLFYSFGKAIQISFSNILLFISAMLIYALLLFSTYYSFGNEHFTVLSATYLLCCCVLFIGQQDIYFTVLILLLAFVYQLFAGIGQLIQGGNFSEISSLQLQGSLQNSGIYACYLVASLPFTYFLMIDWQLATIKTDGSIQKHAHFLRWVYKIRVLIFLLILSVAIYLVFKTQSRTAYIALLIIVLVWVLRKYGEAIKIILLQSRFRFLLWSIIFFSICAASVGAYFLFGMKKMSAMGRLMKLRITGEHLWDNFWLGTGLGRFSWHYPQWQAEYFKNTAHPPQDYYLSAGESYIIFNEYIQLFKEVGFVGFLIFSLLIIYFFTSKSIKHKKLLIATKLTVVAILACGFTSYPFHVNILLLMLLFCFFTAIRLRENKTVFDKLVKDINPSIYFIEVVFLLVFSGYCCYKGSKEFLALKKWESINYKQTIVADMEVSPLYNTLQHNGKFLTRYGSWLAEDSATGSKAVTVLKQAKQHYISRQSMEATARAYTLIGNYKMAIIHWEWISNFLPSKFNPRNELLNAYKLINDTINLKSIAHKIVEMPVKIPSDEVNRIKENAKQVLSELEKD